MIGIRSAISIRARGHTPHLEAVYMTAPRSVRRNTKKPLPKGSRPYMTKETLMPSTPFDLTGKVAVITGSSRGIGRSSAELLAKLGAKVVISSRKADACETVADGIRKGGGDAHVIACNISRKAEVEALIEGSTKH